MIFDPATAATSGASFAALLAAILLAVLGQLALGDAGASDHKHAKSLGLGLPVLALLLATTYMFVLLSGLTTVPVHHPLTQAYEAVALLRRSAFLFILCGSALAVSAAAVILIIGLVISESGTTNKLVRGSAHGTLIGGIIADGIFLVYGYYDIASAFDWHSLIWVTAAGSSLMLPTLCLPFFSGTLGDTVSKLGEKYPSRVFIAGFVGLVILPVLFFRIWFSHNFSGSVPYGNATGPLLFTMGCALWAGIFLSVCIWISQRLIVPEIKSQSTR